MFSSFFCYFNNLNNCLYLFTPLSVFFIYRFSLMRLQSFSFKRANLLYVNHIFYRFGLID